MTQNPWKDLPKFDKKIEINFPKVKVKDINGIKLYYFQDTSIELTGFRAFFEVGCINEKKIGVAEITADLMTKNTLSKSAEEIFAFTDSLGCDLECSVSHDFTAFTYSGLSKFLGEGVSLIAEMISEPKFLLEELDRTIATIKSDLEFSYSTPSAISHIVANRILFEGHRYQFGTTAEHSDLETITIADCQDYYENSFCNTTMSLICVGNFNEAELFKLIETNFKQNSNTKESITSNTIFNYNSGIAIIDSPFNQQTNLKLGMPTIGIDHPDFLALSVANTLFGGYFLSRLNHNLREDKGLTYGINSIIQRYKLASVFFISSSISAEKTKEGIGEILNEMQIISAENVKEEEITRAKQYLMGTSLRLFESSLSILSSTTNLLISDLDLDHYENRYNKLQNLSFDEVYEVQKKYFKPENYVLSLVGNAEKLSADFSESTNVQYDKYGDRLKING